ncbi:MAG: PilZ domain-containing protein [Methylomonas sp.]|nr:PilZ domain-containing protein [Methylomonas sp.]PPD20406.1 MAG: pilus assembly protein PilZ [Methylomonas sp.]PPD25673.1 MAG: pilus assembly protein PilZ [Methylomonas sp.]PPD36650.1 MAG: pilus assembly protein PilZ [Methylomonas sp.]PPD40557.1 MAG: pilus assembly protein PilZ [Methylomonas sp.]
MTESSHADDRRHFHRVLYRMPCQLAGNECLLSCTVVDLSLKGCLLEFQQSWQGDIEHLYVLTIALSDDQHIEMTLSVSHVIGNRVGFKCEHIDIDSITSLRRLVELNLGDSDWLERDLLALGQF